MDMPATFRIRVHGCPSQTWIKGMWGELSVITERADEDVQTIFVGTLADQAALLGIMNALYNMGYAVVSVEQVPTEADIHPDEA